MEENLLCGGEFFHIHWFAHILNLIVQLGLKVALTTYHEIRGSITYMKKSKAKMRNLEKCVRRVSVDIDVHSRLDVPIRWNSTYLMLKSSLRFRCPFIGLALRFKCPFISGEEER